MLTNLLVTCFHIEDNILEELETTIIWNNLLLLYEKTYKQILKNSPTHKSTNSKISIRLLPADKVSQRWQLVNAAILCCERICAVAHLRQLKIRFIRS